MVGYVGVRGFYRRITSRIQKEGDKNTGKLIMKVITSGGESKLSFLPCYHKHLDLLHRPTEHSRNVEGQRHFFLYWAFCYCGYIGRNEVR